MADDSLSKVLAHLQSAARAAGKTIDPTPLTEGEKHALLAKLEQEARASSAAIQQAAAAAAARQASSTSPPPTNPQHPGRVYLVDTWPHRQAIKASGQAGYDTMARGWYLLDPSNVDRIPPQCLPQGLAAAGAGGRAAQTAQTADPAPAMVPPGSPESPARHDLGHGAPHVPPPGAGQGNTRLAAILPWWPQEARAVPNLIVRCALFGVVRRGRREHLEQVLLPAIGGVSVTYTGARLDQADLDVWMGILELFKGQDLAMRLGRAVVPAREFLRSIGRSGGGNDIAWLERTLARLQATTLQIRLDDQIYRGSLIVRSARDETTGQLMIEIDPLIGKLFQDQGWSRIGLEARQALGQDQLAKWLHAFYSSHAAPYAIKIQALQQWSGSTASAPREFRRELREALARVSQATGWHMDLTDDDRVEVVKPERLAAS